MGILDELQRETGNVRIELTNGDVVFGMPGGITAEEAKNRGKEKELRFYQWGIRDAVCLTESDIKKYNRCAAKIDVLDQLQSEKGYVKVLLKSGEAEYGKADCIFFDEDEEEREEKRILFYPYGNQSPKALALEEVVEYERCNESDIPRNRCRQ